MPDAPPVTSATLPSNRGPAMMALRLGRLTRVADELREVSVPVVARGDALLDRVDVVEVVPRGIVDQVQGLVSRLETLHGVDQRASHHDHAAVALPQMLARAVVPC